MKKSILTILIITVLLTFVGCGGGSSSNEQPTSMSNSDYILQMAFEDKQNDLQVKGIGNVTRLLSDDNTGSRHQRFILKLSSGQTLLVSHNIDLSTRIDILAINDFVEFYGVYEWNNEGGVIHWTHDDPNGIHEDGWLKHKGIIYH